jgi:hypothetical protein
MTNLITLLLVLIKKGVLRGQTLIQTNDVME